MTTISWNYLSHFRDSNGDLYEHQFETTNDTTRLIDKRGDVVYSVDFGARLYDRTGSEIGAFHLDSKDLWTFHIGPLVIKTGNRNLLKAEMKIFKSLISA